MGIVNVLEHLGQLVEIQGHKCFMLMGRIGDFEHMKSYMTDNHADVNMYDIRFKSEDDHRPYLIENHVYSRYMGTILTKNPLKWTSDAHSFIKIDADTIKDMGKEIRLLEFLNSEY